MDTYETKVRLQEAVVAQLGDEGSLVDVHSHGASAGFPGFTYYIDTCAFYEANEEAIWDTLAEEAEQQGVTVLEMIASWPGAKQVESDVTFKNLLSWFALEHVAAYFD
jgi:hypothetical protein